MNSGTIKHIDSDGQWNGLKKTKVTFKDGRAYTFFSKGDFKGDIGDTIKYTVTNEDMYNAKLVRVDWKNKKISEEFEKNENEEININISSENSYIVKQNCIKASANFNSNRVADIDDVIKDAEKMYNWINK